jgi:K+-transporting ATPase A subunit
MKKNMGAADRIIRVIIAAILIALYFTGMITGAFGIILIALAAIFVLTSMVGFCPLYLPFGLSTVRKKLAGKN